MSANKHKWIIYILSMLPAIAAVLVVPTKIDPYDFALELTGTWAVIWFSMAVIIGPTGRILKKPQVFASKQPLGLATFTWALLHVFYYFYYNQSETVNAGKDILTKPSITVGAIAFLVLMILTATSYKSAVKYLRKKWNVIHSTVVIAAVAVSAHALTFQKTTTTDGGILGLIMISAIAIRYSIEVIRTK